MPGIEDYHLSPMSSIDKIFQSSQGDLEKWPGSITKFFDEKLKSVKNIPSINETPNHLLVDGQIVKFRCMIQDMFDPEIFMDKFLIRDAQGGLRISTCRFKDTISLETNEELVQDHDVMHAERQSFHCISIPGESPWVKEILKNQEPIYCHASTSNPQRSKRSLDEDDMETLEPDQKTFENKTDADCMETDEVIEPKKTKNDQVNDDKTDKTKKVSNPGHELNLPIPDSRSRAAIVKIYDVKDETFKLNEMVEFVGIISLNPTLANAGQDDDNDISADFNKAEVAAKNPPPSLIPRLHVLKYSKLNHNHPQLPQESQSVPWEELRRSRDDLHSILSQMLLGDNLSAEYVLCYLMSQIYNRKDGLSLGKFSLNLFNIPIAGNFSKRLFTILQLLVTKSHYFPLKVENLNSSRFLPKKDYASNRLISGRLQLSAGTNLFLDETLMANGQLNQDGIINLTSIGNVIKFQTLDYDFGFHKLGFETDIPCLILSEGRSMLPQDVQVMFKPQKQASEESFANLDLDLLNRLRNYIVLAKNLNFEMNEEAQKFVQEDFVNERQKDNSNIKTSDDLHELLVLARLLAISRGEKSINPNLWNEAKNLEQERKQRSAHLPSRPSM